MNEAWLGLGGNLGDPQRQMASALRLLDDTDGVRVRSVSSVYRTPPWGRTDQPDFLNCCAGVLTELAAADLLDVCLSVERRLHRERTERWGPRTIDIDLLDFNGAVSRSAHLELPHPRMSERAFVLVPLAEIAPNLRIEGQSVVDLRGRLGQSGIELAHSRQDWWRT